MNLHIIEMPLMGSVALEIDAKTGVREKQDSSEIWAMRGRGC